MKSTPTLLIMLGSALVGITLGACFNGQQSEGLPCSANSHCGPTLECIFEYCGGVFICADGQQISAEDICDGDPDCDDASDEDCSDAFFCDDGSTVPLEATCDGVDDCEDGEDEAAGICVVDQCTMPEDLFEFFPGANVDDGADNPLGVYPGDFIGGGQTDLMFAPRNGTYVRLVNFTMASGPVASDLPADGDTSIFSRPVKQVIPFDFESNGTTDILVRTDDARIYAYVSSSENDVAPVQLTFPGAEYFEIPTIPAIAGMAAGSHDGDPFVDLVVLTEQGRVLTAIADPNIGTVDIPFTFGLTVAPIYAGTANYIQVELVDIDGDGLDEMFVLGFADGPQLFYVSRKGGGGVTLETFWNDSLQFPFPAGFMPNEFVVGYFDANLSPDFAFLDSINGKVMVAHHQGMDNPYPLDEPVLDISEEISGLTVVDLDCNGMGGGGQDLIFNVVTPPSIKVLFTDQAGQISLDHTISIASLGVPQGNVAVTRFDPDSSWDVFHATTGSGNGPEILGYLSSEMVGP